jgi:hypothetical protein
MKWVSWGDSKGAIYEGLFFLIISTYLNFRDIARFLEENK